VGRRVHALAGETDYGFPALMSDDQPRRGLDEIPPQAEDPIVWDPAQRRFVPSSERLGGAPAPPPDPRRFFVGADAVGRDLPPQPGTPPPAPVAPSAVPVDATITAAAAAPAAPVPRNERRRNRLRNNLDSRAR